MSLIFNIFLNNISPIIILVGLGMVLGRKFQLDTFSLSKMLFFLFTPSFIFYQMYTADIDISYLKICLFALVLMLLSMIICRVIAKMGKYPRSVSNAFVNSVIFYNSGNFGLPLITLIFAGTPWLNQAVTAHIMILLFQNTTMHIVGFMNADSGKMHWKESLAGVLKMPLIYATCCAFLFKLLPFRLEEQFFWPSIRYLSNGLIPSALTLLGVQLGRTKFKLDDHRVYVSAAVRLILIPFAAYFLVRLFGFTGAIGRAVFIATGSPTAITTALIAMERNNEPDFASQMVLTTTLFCMVTLVAIISLSEKLFPIIPL